MLTVNDSYALVTSTSATSSPLPFTNMFMWDATAVITDSTPVAVTFALASGNNFTATAHGFLTGLKVVNTTTGSLPTGLTGSAEYVIVIDANTIAFATSQANAIAGTAITITGAGTGVQTSTPQALVGTLVFQKSDAVALPSNPSPSYNWVTIATPTTAASQAVSATTLNYYDTQAGYSNLRALLTITSGQASVALQINAKGQ